MGTSLNVRTIAEATSHDKASPLVQGLKQTAVGDVSERNGQPRNLAWSIRRTRLRRDAPSRQLYASSVTERGTRLHGSARLCGQERHARGQGLIV